MRGNQKDVMERVKFVAFANRFMRKVNADNHVEVNEQDGRPKGRKKAKIFMEKTT